MTLNKTKIEWCDRTWNPVTGCKHGCAYCYARKIAERFRGTKAWPNGFEPTLRPERLDDPVIEYDTEQSIFVCSMADLFGEWVPEEWIHAVFKSMHKAYWHTYMILTKNPARINRVVPGDMYADNIWLGTSVESMATGQRICDLQKIPQFNKFVSFEPLLNDVGLIDLSSIGQVIIGARTKPKNNPPFDTIIKIQKEADRVGAKVFCKNTLSYLNIGDRNNFFRRELVWRINKSLALEDE